MLGAQGQLGKAVQQVLLRNGLPFTAPGRLQADVTDTDKLNALLKSFFPDFVINCAAYNDVERAEQENERAFCVNAQAPAQLAEMCRRQRAMLFHFSTDYVFDGTKGDYYTEADCPNPLGVYGASKYQGECDVLAAGGDFAAVFRLSWLFGEGRQNFLYKLEDWATRQKTLRISEDEVSIPTYTGDVADAILAAAAKRVGGLYHLASTGCCSRYEWAKYYLAARRLQVEIVPVPMSSFPVMARRPLFSPLSNRKLSGVLGCGLPSWQAAIDRYLADIQNSRVCPADLR